MAGFARQAAKAPVPAQMRNAARPTRAGQNKIPNSSPSCCAPTPPEGGHCHLEGWDVLYNHLECYITKPVCYITILQMLYNMRYITCVVLYNMYYVKLKVI